MQIMGVEDGVGNDAAAFFEAPAAFAHEPVNDGKADGVLEAFEGAHDQRAVRPWAGIGDVEMITPGLRLEAAFAGRAGCAVGRHPIAEMRGLPLETAPRP